MPCKILRPRSRPFRNSTKGVISRKCRSRLASCTNRLVSILWQGAYPLWPPCLSGLVCTGMHAVLFCSRQQQVHMIKLGDMLFLQLILIQILTVLSSYWLCWQLQNQSTHLDAALSCQEQCQRTWSQRDRQLVSQKVPHGIACLNFFMSVSMLTLGRKSNIFCAERYQMWQMRAC